MGASGSDKIRQRADNERNVCHSPASAGNGYAHARFDRISQFTQANLPERRRRNIRGFNSSPVKELPDFYHFGQRDFRTQAADYSIHYYMIASERPNMQ
jgi:hypothetical protein